MRTFLATIQVISTFRDRADGLLLSELGGCLETPDKAPAGTKRLSNLLHSCKWAAWLIANFLWQRASQQLEGLCAVRSSKAKRLTHDKPGYYAPPQKPIFVPGLPWRGQAAARLCDAVGTAGGACL